MRTGLAAPKRERRRVTTCLRNAHGVAEWKLLLNECAQGPGTGERQ
jgi:hypothetical protein